MWGVLLGPLSLLAVVGLPSSKAPNRRTHAQCHVCYEFVLPQARKCKHCLTDFAPDKYTVAALRSEEARKNSDKYVRWFGVAAVAAMVLVGITVVLFGVTNL